MTILLYAYEHIMCCSMLMGYSHSIWETLCWKSVCQLLSAGEALEMRVDSLVTFNSCISACELLGWVAVDGCRISRYPMGYNARPELIFISSVLPVLDPTMFLWWFAQSCWARHKKIKQNSVESNPVNVPNHAATWIACAGYCNTELQFIYL